MRGVLVVMGLVALACGPKQAELDEANRQLAIHQQRVAGLEQVVATWQHRAQRCEMVAQQGVRRAESLEQEKQSALTAAQTAAQRADHAEQQAASQAARIAELENERLRARQAALRQQEEARRITNIPIPGTVARFRMGMSRATVAAQCRRAGGYMMNRGPSEEQRCSLVGTSASALRLDLPFALSVIDFEYCGAALCEIELYPDINTLDDIANVFDSLQSRYGRPTYKSTEDNPLCKPAISGYEWAPFTHAWRWPDRDGKGVRYYIVAGIGCDVNRLHRRVPVVTISYLNSRGVRKLEEKEPNY